MVLEQMIEPTGNFKYLMQSVIDDDMKKDLHKAEINNDELRNAVKNATYLPVMMKHFWFVIYSLSSYTKGMYFVILG